MTELLDWLVNLPKYLADFGNWITTPIYPDWPSPIAFIGTSALAIVGIIIGWNIFQLIKPW